MRVIVDVDGVRRPVEVVRAGDQVRLVDLIGQACGCRIEPDRAVWVDDHQHTAATPLPQAGLLEGSVIGLEQMSYFGPRTLGGAFNFAGPNTQAMWKGAGFGAIVGAVSS